MTQEIQLSQNRGVPAGAEPWATSNLAPAGPQQTPLNKIHRSLRGRYILAFLLAFIGAAAGAAAGWLLPKPAFRSDGLISIEATIPNTDSYDRVMTMYSSYIQKQVARLKSERLVKMAMEYPAWKEVHPSAGSPGADQVAAFSNALTVTPPKTGTLIAISFQDPDARVACAGVKSIVNTYDKSFKGIDTSAVDVKVKYHRANRDAAAAAIRADKKLIEDLSQNWGYDDLSVMLTARMQEQVRLDGMVRDAEFAVRNAEEASKFGAELSVDEIAKVDSTMATLLKIKGEAEIAVEQLLAGNMSENHPAVKLARSRLQIREQEVDKYAKKFRAEHGGLRRSPDGTPNGVLPRNLDDMKRYVALLKETAEEARKKTAEIGETHTKIVNAKAEIREQEEIVKDADRKIKELEWQSDYIGVVTIISDGDAAATAVDNRLKFSALGFMLGGGLPLMLVMMIGLLDHRYRFSDETGAEMQGITLLGILPNLPDRLSDPEQAAIAAHCVHQIRTMLQINGGPEERRVFAVTSASPGDGKTSLTLALGLSYAACGTRTLLIDCDLVGGGLTSRMNVSSPEGVLEAIANRSLLEYVRSTDIADVAILPVGSAHGHHASTLSPAALRRLIDEAEKHFEIILVDTGPILGSIEASLVCAAADGVVLTVARGQQRPLVEKSLAHLNAIGARLAGVVFNRAQASDFERSMSGVSMRSVAQPAGNGLSRGENGSQYGPVARAVASQQRPSNGN